MSGFSSFTGFTQLRAYGTSYMADPAIIADAQGHEMFRQVATRGGITDVVSNGVSSSRLTEIAGRILGPSPAGQSTVQDASYPAGNAAGRLVLIDGTTNNFYTQSGTSSITPGESNAGTEALRAMFAALGAGERIDDTDSRWTYGGGWSAASPATRCSGNSFHYSGTTGASASCTWTQPANCDHVYFAGLGTPASGGGFLSAPLSFSVDGAAATSKAFAGTLDSYVSNAANGGTVDISNVVVRIAVPTASTPTSRTLTVVQGSGGSGALGVIDCLLIPSATPPRVVFCKSPPLPAGSSAASVNTFVAAVNALVAPVVAEFSGYVHAVDWQGTVNGAYNADAMIGPDLIHPNLAGETHVTDQVVADINGYVPTTAPIITSPLTATATVGQAFSYQATATNNPDGFDLDPSPPADLAFDDDSGLLNGMARAAGTHVFELSAHNAGGEGTATLTLTITAAAVYPAANQVLAGVHYGPAGTDYTGTYAPVASTYTSAVNVRAGTDRGDGTVGTLVLPPADKVLAGTTFDGVTAGTATVPSAAQVLAGVTFGTGGNALTGNVVLPGAGIVKSGATYGSASGTTGTYEVDLPPADQVLFGVTYGAPQAPLTGAYMLPMNPLPAYAPAENVRLGTDRGDGVTGTCHVPTASQVLFGVAVDATTGNVTLPSAANLRTGVQCGVSSTSITGTLIVTAPNPADLAAAMWAYGNRTLTQS